MIPAQKLLCAFVYGASAAGKCGPKSELEKEVYESSLLDCIKNNGLLFPEAELKKYNPKLMGMIKSQGIRDYIYKGHLLVISPTPSCAVHFYNVDRIEDNKISGTNILIPSKKQLSVLEGLEIPKKDDVVSVHWNYMLEIVTDCAELPEYKKIAKEYFDDFGKLMKKC